VFGKVHNDYTTIQNAEPIAPENYQRKQMKGIVKALQQKAGTRSAVLFVPCPGYRDSTRIANKHDPVQANPPPVTPFTFTNTVPRH
jgi:hypothetical protein